MLQYSSCCIHADIDLKWAGRMAHHMPSFSRTWSEEVPNDSSPHSSGVYLHAPATQPLSCRTPSSHPIPLRFALHPCELGSPHHTDGKGSVEAGLVWYSAVSMREPKNFQPAHQRTPQYTRTPLPVSYAKIHMRSAYHCIQGGIGMCARAHARAFVCVCVCV